MVCVQTTASCCKVNRLGECRHYFMVVTSWSKFYVLVYFFVLVWLSLPWRDFITLSDIIRIFFSVLDEIFVLVGFVCLGVILHLGAINRILVWFFFALNTIFVLVRFYFFWCRFISRCDINCILVWFFFILLGSFVLVWYCLIWCHFISWCDYSALPNKHTIMLISFCKIGNAVILLLGAVW